MKVLTLEGLRFGPTSPSREDGITLANKVISHLATSERIVLDLKDLNIYDSSLPEGFWDTLFARYSYEDLLYKLSVKTKDPFQKGLFYVGLVKYKPSTTDTSNWMAY